MKLRLLSITETNISQIMKPFRLFFFLFICLLRLIAQETEGKEKWPLGLYGSRNWSKIELPGTLCGNGKDSYSFFYSPAISEKGSYRLTVYFPGGGSTMVKPDGSISTNMSSLLEAKNLLSIGAPAGQKILFMDRPENDLFIGEGHWAIFPYCTQDMHIGHRTEAISYDFTNTDASAIKSELETILNWKPKYIDLIIDSLKKEFPFITIEQYKKNSEGKYIITSLKVGVIHRGGLNTEVAIRRLMELVLQETPNFLNKAQIAISGGSAGGFGSWYNAIHFGDLIYEYPDTRLTLIPMGAIPIEKKWDDNLQELVLNTEIAGMIDYKFSYYEGLRPCEVEGGAYYFGSDYSCNDVSDLIKHYRDKRYPDMDILFAPIANKQDFALASNLLQKYTDENELKSALMNLCKTAHAYGDELALLEKVHPYMLWSYLNEKSKFDLLFGQTAKPEHVPTEAALLVPLSNQYGTNKQSDENILLFINKLCNRISLSSTPYIEYNPTIILEPVNPSSETEIFYNLFDGNYNECNCTSKYNTTNKVSILNKDHLIKIKNWQIREQTLSFSLYFVNADNYSINVFDLTGRTLFTKEINAIKESSYQTIIPLYHLNTEYYIINIGSKESSLAFKFLAYPY